jgi:predicted permease
MLDDLAADVRYAFRWLRRSPVFTVVAVASLAAGIGLNTALFTAVDALLLRPLPVSRPDRLVDVFTTGNGGAGFATSSYPDYLDLRDATKTLEGLAGFSPALAAVAAGERSRLAVSEVVTGNYFAVLGVAPQAGRLLEPEDDRPGAPRVAVISDGLWQREYGGNLSALGGIVRIHGQPYTIVGIAPREFRGMFPVLSAELWTATAWVSDLEPGGIVDTTPSPSGTGWLDRRGTRWMFLKGRLKDGQTPESAGAELAVLMQRLATTYPQTNKDRRLAVLRTSDVHVHPTADRTIAPVAAGLMAVVGLVLLVACANLASMLLARASHRRKEISLRLAIGASRARLIRQLLTETALVAVMGAVAGLFVAWGLTRAAASIHLPIPIPFGIAMRLDARVLVYTIGVTFIATLAAGLVPALAATKRDLVSDLKGEAAARAGRRRFTLRDILVAGQVAVTVVVLVSAGLLVRSLFASQRAPLGFESEGVAIVSTELSLIGYTDERGAAYYERALERVRALPGVVSAALAERTPLALNFNRNTFLVPGQTREAQVDATAVSADYFATLGVRVVEGRGFTPSDTPSSPRVVIVNRSFARRFWPTESAVGKILRRDTADGRSFVIVGVSADYKVNSVGEDPTPYVHYAVSQRPSTGESILARIRGDARALVPVLRKELLALEPNAVLLDEQTLEAQVGAKLAPARFGALGVSGIGLLAMLLAAVGLYGVIAYSVAQRTREIGIRMALGARPGSVFRLVMTQGFAVVAAGAVTGGLLAVVAARAVSGALYGLGPSDPAAWAGALGLVLFVACLANAAPAFRAARVAPSEALRAE